MKTLRTIGATLMAALLCVNFSSCSKEEVEGDSATPDMSGKKLVEMKIKEDAQHEAYANDYNLTRYYYDDNNQLATITNERVLEGGKKVSSTDYTLTENQIIATSEDEKTTFKLNKGLVISTERVISEYGDTYTTKSLYQYDSNKHLISSSAPKGEEFSVSFNWQKGKLVGAQSSSGESGVVGNISYSYLDKQCKGYCPLIPSLFLDEEESVSCPQLFGLWSKNLPSKIINRIGSVFEMSATITYTFDNDGYISGLKMVQTSKDLTGEEQPRTKTIHYSFRWE